MENFELIKITGIAIVSFFAFIGKLFVCPEKRSQMISIIAGVGIQFTVMDMALKLTYCLVSGALIYLGQFVMKQIISFIKSKMK
jgi:hypothetical protein